jgi:hypothetical protein
MFRYGLVLLAGVCTAAPAPAASWADGLFEELSKDFGSVPRGPTLTHAFRLKNTTDRTVRISGIRVSCGCVSAMAATNELAPGKSTIVQANMDTRRFSGVKSVTVYVQFDLPQWEEVRLWVQANARDDISVQPEALSFGRAKRGSVPTNSVTVSFVGNPQWAISEVEKESHYIETSLKELRRDASEVSYQVTARIRADAPIGKWYSDLWLKTNDPAIPKVRVPLTVEIESGLTLSPSTVMLGQVQPGAEAQRKVIVRGVKPFRITRVEGTDDQLLVQDSTTESKPVHVLTVTLKPRTAGEVDRKLKILTDLPEDSEVEFEAKASVAAAEQ